MYKTVVLPLACLLTLGLGGCKKKPQAKAKGDSDPMAMTASMAGMGGDMNARPAGGAQSAAAACAKGARPGHAIDKPEYSLTVTAPTAAKAGQTVQAVLQVVPKAGYKINLKYPTELTIKPAPGVELPRAKFEKSHAKELTAQKLVFEVAHKAKAAGKKVVTAELGFSVCTPKLCITEPDMCVAWEVTGQ